MLNSERSELRLGTSTPGFVLLFPLQGLRVLKSFRFTLSEHGLLLLLAVVSAASRRLRFAKVQMPETLPASVRVPRQPTGPLTGELRTGRRRCASWTAVTCRGRRLGCGPASSEGSVGLGRVQGGLYGGGPVEQSTVAKGQSLSAKPEPSNPESESAALTPLTPT